MNDQMDKPVTAKNGSKWLKLLLVVSLALNVAFLGPLIYNRLYNRLPAPEETAKHTGEPNVKNGTNPPSVEEGPLSAGPGRRLGKQQKQKIDSVIHKFKLEQMRYRQDILTKRIEIIDELGDPEYDPQTITTRTNELNQLENELNLLFVNTLLEIDGILDGRQRLDFLYRLSRNWFFLGKKGRSRRSGHMGRQMNQAL